MEDETNSRQFADDISKSIYWNKRAWITNGILLEFTLKGSVNRMAWRRIGEPLSEPLMAWFTGAYACITQPISIWWPKRK